MPERICIISTVRSTLHETMCFVNYHLNIGIDEIILFFDDPNDPAAIPLAGYRAVRAIKCDGAYWRSRGIDMPSAIYDRQEINVNYGMQLAAESGFDWFMHIDSDELLLSKGDIKAVLLDQPTDVVRLGVKEAVSERDYYDNIFEATLFKTPMTRDKDQARALASALGCQAVMFEDEYFRGHSSSKTAVRVDSKVERMGLHAPASPEMAETKTDQIILLHYDCVGIANWKAKWLTRVHDPVLLARLRPNRGRQGELFLKAYGNPDDEMELFARLHKIGPNERATLLQHGFLSVVELPRELFARPATERTFANQIRAAKSAAGNVLMRFMKVLS